jgi:uncharacterized protein YidB (DUF937 family)
MEQALKLRKVLAADPEQLIQALELDHLRHLASRVGLTNMPMHHSVAPA